MNTLYPEHGSPPSLESRFSDFIDAKFNVGQPSPHIAKGWIVEREHEESVSLTPVRPLEHCSTARSFRLIRPIPEEADLARMKWDQFGGHRVHVLEVDERGTSAEQTDFFVIGDTMYKRKHHSAPGELVMVPPVALTEAQMADVFDWIDTAAPDQ